MASSEHLEMPQVVLLLKMLCDSISLTGTQVANHSWPFALAKLCTRQVKNRIPGDVTPSWARWWGPLHSCSVSRAIYLPAQRNRQPARPIPQTEAPIAPRQGNPGSRVTLARKYYGIIFTVMIPAVSSGATWTLSLRNSFWTCITQVQSILSPPSTMSMTWKNIENTFFGKDA